MRRRAVRRAGATGALGALVLVVASACGGSSTGAVVEDTRALGAVTTAVASSAATTAPAGSTTSAGPTSTTVADSTPVSLGGATQETAAPGATTTAAAPRVTVPIDAPTPDGYQRAADPEGLVSVAAPSSWTFVPLDDKTLQDLANQTTNAFPEATRAQMAAAVAAAGDYIKVLGVSPAVNGRASTVNVIITPAAVPITVMKAIYPKQIESAGSTLTSLTDLTVSGRPALRADIKLNLANGTAQSHQIVIPITGKTVIVSIAEVDDATLTTMIGAIVVPKTS